MTGLEIAGGGGWEVTLAAGDAMAADGVVITGAGPAITVPGQPRDHSRVLDGRTYWLAAHELARERAVNVCVVGSGETAASVVIDLLKRCHRHSTIDVLATRGVLYSRGESYDENRFYSDPADWPRLAEAHRREFLERTDRGVFSLQAEATLNQARGFRTLAGRAAAVQAREHDVIVTIAYDEERERVAYDAVVVAIGFDGRWFEALLGDHASARYRRGARRRRAGALHRPRPVRGRPAAAAPAGHGRARAGAGVPESQLPRPAERPHPAPLCRGQRCRSAGTGEEAACLS